MIYTLVICSVSLFIAMGCYRMEFLVNKNANRMEKNSAKIDKLQKIKEYLLTKMDEYIYKNVIDINEEEISKFLYSLDNMEIYYEGSYIKYDKNNDCFLVQYNINNVFLKEELYEYKVKDTSIIYGCIDYSFIKGELK